MEVPIPPLRQLLDRHSAGEASRIGHGAAGALTVHSMGGLGNQLFIYGAGLSAARSSGARLRIDVSQHAMTPARRPQLEELDLPAEYVDLGLRPPEPNRRGQVMQRLRPSHHVPQGCNYREATFDFDDEVLAREPGSCLYGYFQSWRYLRTAAAELRSHLSQLSEQRAHRFNAVGLRLDEPTAITIHVRRGDYLTPGANKYHGVAGLRFYRDAVAVLRRMGFDGPVHLFSDDVIAAHRELRDLPGLQPPTRPSLTDVDELLLMSRASALVTANSSFSWWAGWLGDRPDRPVIAPRPWFDAAGPGGRDLLPPHWLTLDRRDLG